MSLFSIPCIVFAGGKSSRMGEDKSLLPFDNADTLVQYQHDRMETFFDRVYISAKAGTQYDFDPMVIEDAPEFHELAPTSGLLSMFKRLKAENSFFILSVDAPFVALEVLEKFAKASATNFDATIVRTPSGIHPLCGVYNRGLEAPLFEMYLKGEHKLGKLLQNAKVQYIDIDDENLLMNVNTPDEYQRALEHSKQKSF